MGIGRGDWNVRLELKSSLAKIFPMEDIGKIGSIRSGTVLQGERFTFQGAYRFGKDWGGYAEVEIETPLKCDVTVSRVELAPVLHAGYSFDDDVIGKGPGLYPDILKPYDGKFRIAPNQWRSIWVSVDVAKDCPAGKYPIHLKIIMRGGEDGDTVGQRTLTLEVLPVKLPGQRLIVTHWFHNDCLCHWYGVKVFSEGFWDIARNYMKSFAKHGSTMILTPVFTPPLDTAVGEERLTAQLVGVTVTAEGKYEFDFSLLKRWVDLARECGIVYFEISHLFTQWGAKSCPKIIATVGGRQKRIFGWDTASDSKEYVEFLDAFLPELVKFLKKEKLQRKVYFHCSDEPSREHVQMYRKAVTLLRRHLRGFKICDALSDVDFYRQGLVSTPIPAENHIESFVQAGVKPLWTYYCCGQVDRVSNRFLHFPSSRNRILGALLYRYDIEGFLQWGFNFWNTCLSRAPLNPYEDTSSDYAFPPGDGFMVYPGPDGKPVESIHHEVFLEAMQDLRALQLLEKFMGRHAIERILDKASPGGRMTMFDYPRGEKAVLALRRKINGLIKECAKHTTIVAPSASGVAPKGLCRDKSSVAPKGLCRDKSHGATVTDPASPKGAMP